MICRCSIILHFLVVVIFSTIPQTYLSAQDNDSLLIMHIDFLTDQLEALSSQSEREIDYTDLVEDFLYYARHPINLNGRETRKLVELQLINDIQLNNIASYIHRYGKMLSVYELKNVTGIDNRTYQNMLPFITVEGSDDKEKKGFRAILRKSRHLLIIRYGQVMEPTTGHSLPIDSASAYPGKVCLGSPQSLYARYAFQMADHFRLGFTIEKDAGERMFREKTRDSLTSLAMRQTALFADFQSAHLMLKDIGIIKKAVAGDYHLEFGQGLTLWTGLAFGKSVSGIQVKRTGRGISANTSANENRFLRGGALTLGNQNFQATLFYSSNRIDAHIHSSVTDSAQWINGFLETGKHRTINELINRHSLRVRLFGGRADYASGRFQIGATAYQTFLDVQLSPGDIPYKLHHFNGNRLLNYGLDYQLSFNSISLFGEFSASHNGGIAGVAGLDTRLSERLNFTLLYRYFAVKYHNLFNNPFGQSSGSQNERGLYFGITMLLTKNLSLTGYLDYYRFPWLRYLVDAPSRGRDFQLQANYSPSSTLSMHLRFRTRKKQQNHNQGSFYSQPLITVDKHDWRFFISCQVTAELTLRSRIDYVLVRSPKKISKGYLMYQDLLYRPLELPFNLTFRYALFDTDGFESRIYTYENDVYYAFSIPSYSGSGQRIYLMIKGKPCKGLDIWIRLARTIYSNRKSIGTGCDEIAGNKKTEIRVQAVLKL